MPEITSKGVLGGIRTPTGHIPIVFAAELIRLMTGSLGELRVLFRSCRGARTS
jgi:hypothetical protein